MKRTLRRILTGVLSAALVVPMCSTGTPGSTAEAAETLKPVYQWNFENVEGRRWKMPERHPRAVHC